MINKTNNVLVSLAALTIDEHRYVHRDIVPQPLAANRVNFLENRSRQLRSGADVTHSSIFLFVLPYVLVFDLKSSDQL